MDLVGSGDVNLALMANHSQNVPRLGTSFVGMGSLIAEVPVAPK